MGFRGKAELFEGPTSATDNAIARFDATTGGLIQNTGVTISDTDDLDLADGDLSFDSIATVGVVRETFSFGDMTDGGGTSGTMDLTDTIPDGAVVIQSLCHTLTGFTGDTSAVITIGDGSTADRYNTGTPSVFTTNASGVALGAVSGTAWHDAAATVTVTITSATDFTDVDAGTITVAILYVAP
jgi:hypothetical protein